MLARQLLLVFLLTFWGMLVFSSRVKAAPALDIRGVPDTVEADQVFEFDATFTGEKKYYASTTYYFRAVFFPLETTNYFGFIENNSGGWGNNYNDKTTLYSFTTDEEGSFSGKLRAKADITDSAFSGPNEYGFKLGRYTEKGTSAAPWSSPVVVFINYAPPATPTLEPTSTPMPPTARPTTAPAATPRPTVSPISPSPSSGKVLGEATNSTKILYDLTASPSASPSSHPTKPHTSTLIPLIILVGSMITAGAAIPLGLKFLVPRAE
jgi:hypothetical protein